MRSRVEKADDAFRTIGEMAHELGVKPHILRYWEEQFPMLRPLKRAGGRRLYRAQDMALLHRIRRLLLDEGYTIRGARSLLQGPRRDGAPGTADVEADADMMVALRRIRTRLSRALIAAEQTAR